jgi:hypothetical protein
MSAVVLLCIKTLILGVSVVDPALAVNVINERVAGIVFSAAFGRDLEAGHCFDDV